MGDKKMQNKTKAEIEALCLQMANLVLGAKRVTAIKIKEIDPPGSGPNWTIAEIIQPQTECVTNDISAELAKLWGTYALKEGVAT